MSRGRYFTLTMIVKRGMILDSAEKVRALNKDFFGFPVSLPGIEEQFIKIFWHNLSGVTLNIVVYHCINAPRS